MEHRILKTVYLPSGRLQAGDVRTDKEWLEIFPTMKDENFNNYQDWFEPVSSVLDRGRINFRKAITMSNHSKP